MAQVIVCDRCGKQRKDMEKGWRSMWLQAQAPILFGNTERIDLCQECGDMVKGILNFKVTPTTADKTKSHSPYEPIGLKRFKEGGKHGT